MKKCPICKSIMIEYNKYQYKSIDVKRCIITGIETIYVCPKHLLELKVDVKGEK